MLAAPYYGTNVPAQPLPQAQQQQQQQQQRGYTDIGQRLALVGEVRNVPREDLIRILKVIGGRRIAEDDRNSRDTLLDALERYGERLTASQVKGLLRTVGPLNPYTIQAIKHYFGADFLSGIDLTVPPSTSFYQGLTNPYTAPPQTTRYPYTSAWEDNHREQDYYHHPDSRRDHHHRHHSSDRRHQDQHTHEYNHYNSSSSTKRHHSRKDIVEDLMRQLERKDWSWSQFKRVLDEFLRSGHMSTREVRTFASMLADRYQHYQSKSRRHSGEHHSRSHSRSHSKSPSRHSSRHSHSHSKTHSKSHHDHHLARPPQQQYHQYQHYPTTVSNPAYFTRY